MSDRRYTEFDVKIESHFDPEKKVFQNQYMATLTERDSGKVIRIKIGSRLNNASFHIDQAIIRHFPETKAAKSIIKDLEYGLDMVELDPEKLKMLFTNIHVSLRKTSQSPAAPMWWNILGRLPDPVVQSLISNCRKHLEPYENKAVEVREIGKALDEAFSLTFDAHWMLSGVISGNPPITEALKEPGWTMEQIESLSIKETKEFVEILKWGQMALTWPDNAFWNEMAFSIVKE